MSLLLEALKKAEKAKEEAQRRAKGDAGPELRIENPSPIPEKPVLTRAELLAASRLDKRSWEVKTAAVPLKMLPFTEINEERYTTYLNVT